MINFKELKMNIRARKKVRLSRSVAGNLGVLVFLMLICAFMILPILYAVLQAFKPLDEIFLYPPRFFVRNPTLRNFSDTFYLTESMGVPFLRYVFNSLFVTVVGTFLYIVIASAAGYSLAKGFFRGKVLLTSLVVWALLFRPEVTSIPRYIVVSKLGMVDTYWALILPALSSTLGVFLIQQFVTVAIPDATLEAARIDGASEYNIFLRIVLPGIKPALLTAIIFTFQSFWNSADGTQFIYSETLKSLPNVLSTIVTGGIARAGAGAAVSVILMIPPIVVFLISQSSVMETMTHSGLK
jgi:ABC-type glycerol-3-phosphate transport system permease component